jgi:organic radical activating enzyme
MSQGIITQICVTVQGEGPTAGTPVLLIRLGNCNLTCDFCDTQWSRGLKSFEMPTFIGYGKDIEIKYPLYINSDCLEDFCKYLLETHIKDYKINTALITGGEPFLNQDFLIELCDDLLINTDIKHFEIETNGTLVYGFEYDYPLQLNVSPKLNPNFYLTERITNLDDIIELFKSNMDIFHNPANVVSFKFVYNKDSKNDIDWFIEQLKIKQNFEIYIMPLTPDYSKFNSEIEFFEAFRQSCYETLDYCIENGYNFSPRMHIWLFNNFTNRNEFEEIRDKK